MHIEELRDGTVINLTGKVLYIFHYIVSDSLLYGYMTLLQIIFGGKKMNIMLLLVLLLPITIVVFFLWSLVETMTEMAREKDLFGVIVSGSSAFFIAYGLYIFILKVISVGY